MALFASVLLVCLLLCFLQTPSIVRASQLESGFQLLDVFELTQEDDELMHSNEAQSLQWAHSTNNGDSPTLTLRLMHRDSPFSPLRKPQPTSQELFFHRLTRDAARVQALSNKAQMAALGLKNSDLVVQTVSFSAQENQLSNFTGPVVSGLKQGSGEYFTRIGVGTPAQESFMVLDTGSDILWLQCSPCLDCYSQTDPVFNPRTSSSFKKLSCSSPICSKLELHGCHSRTKSCLYQVSYGDGSFTVGDFSMETVSFNRATLRNVALGCGHDNEGLFVGAAGLLGLGGGSLSFPSQMGRIFGKKFSYCLVDRDRRGYSSLIFGNGAVPEGTLFTPLLKNSKLATFYYVSLTGISVGGNRLSIPASAFKLDGTGNGGVIVDSGTSVTRLVETAYGPLRSAFRAATRRLPSAGGFSLFDTCYDFSGMSSVKVPTVVLHFEGGADVSLPASNYLVTVDGGSTFCLAFASTAGQLSIIGNIQQQGFRVVFDGESSRLGFAANQC